MIKLVQLTLALTDEQLVALTMIRRGEIKGLGWPDYVTNHMAESLIVLGVISHQGDVTTVGHLIIQATGNDSVVTQ